MGGAEPSFAARTERVLEIIFDISDYRILEVYDWRGWALLCLFGFVLTIFAGLGKYWPLSQFYPFKGQGWLVRLAPMYLTLTLALGHSIPTVLSLQNAKAAVIEETYRVRELSYDGPRRPSNPLTGELPEMGLTFEQNLYSVPGLFDGMEKFLPVLRRRLETNETYSVYTVGNTILKIEKVYPRY